MAPQGNKVGGGQALSLFKALKQGRLETHQLQLQQDEGLVLPQPSADSADSLQPSYHQAWLPAH